MNCTANTVAAQPKPTFQNSDCKKRVAVDEALLQASIEIGEKKFKTALNRIEGLEGKDDTEGLRMLLIGRCHEGLGVVSKALSAYERSRALGNVEALLRAGVVRFVSGDPLKACRLIHKYVQKRPGNPEAYFYLSMCDDNAEKRAKYRRKVLALDGPNSRWSSRIPSEPGPFPFKHEAQELCQ